MATILCIDDRAQQLGVRKQLLETEGHFVLTAVEGRRGIQIARDQSVDAVVLDYEMPGINGFQIAEVLKSEHPNVPIVLLTGVPAELPGRLLSLVDAYVKKGEGALNLLSAIDRVLQGRC